MFSGLFKRTPETPDIDLSHDERERLITLLAAHPEVTFPHLDGLAIGLSITHGLPMSELAGLLGLGDAAPELLELISRYAQDMQSATDSEVLAPRLENVESLQTFSAWLGGVGQAVALDPDRGVPLLQSGSAETRSTLSMLLAFTPVWSNTPKAQVRHQLKVRDHYLEQLKGESADGLLQITYSLVSELIDIYGDAALISLSSVGGSGTIRRSEPKTGPNQPCPCGSGKKYKKCHGAPGQR